MRRRIHNITLALTLALAIVLVPFHGPSVNRAHALSLGGLGGGEAVRVVSDTSTTNIMNTIKATLSEVSNAVSAAAQQSLVLKEFTLDGIARSLSQNALNQLTAGMINWVNGGMNGSPSFVTNLEEFLQNVADETAGEFIYGPELDRLCEPIRFEVKAALLTQYTEEERGTYTPQCTLDKVAGADAEAFMAGDFDKGGWRAFFELTVGSNNDPVKAYFDGQVKLAEETAKAEERKNQELAWSGGFLNKEACQLIQTATGFSRKRCETLTPGALVRDTLSYFVGELPAQRLLQIDEFNEVFTALSGSLSNLALQGTFGLLGLGGSNKYSDNRFGTGSQSYVDALFNEQYVIDQGPAGNAIKEAIAAEEGYQDIQLDIIDAVDDLEEQIEEGEEEYPECFALELDEEFEEDREDAEENLEVSDLVLDVLVDMDTKLATATTTAAQDAVYKQYFALEQNNLIRTKYDNQKLRTEFYELNFMTRVDDFQVLIEREMDRCEAREGV